MAKQNIIDRATTIHGALSRKYIRCPVGGTMKTV